MSQAELASKLDYDSVTAISLIEQDKRKLPIGKLSKISQIFGVSISDLVGIEEPHKKTLGINAALRTYGDLDEKDIKEIENYISYIKFKSGKKKRG
jgi:transcriptional regulator with XRE-family HTH domain